MQRRYLLYNGAGLACFAASGMVANFLIARVYGPADTGLFNQVLAFYVVAGQFAVFGIHLAALRDASLLPRGSASCAVSRLVANALAVTCVSALVTMAAGALFDLIIPSLFVNGGLAAAWLLVLPSLCFFAFNKVLIGIANGLERHAVFAIAQAGRPVLFLGFCCWWIYEGWSGQTIVLSLTLAEFLLAIFLMLYFFITDGAASPVDLYNEGRRLLGFGVRVLPGSTFADLNTRVDVIILSLFVPASTIGVYTLAAWIAEGALQVPAAVRPLLSARIAQLSSSRSHAQLASMIRRVGLLVMATMACCLTIVCYVFPVVVDHLLTDPRYREALVPLVILSFGIVIGSYYLPFDFLLSQSGRPLAQSAVRGTMIAVNIALALVLVPIFGTTGAALAYSLSFLAYVASFQIASTRVMETRA